MKNRHTLGLSKVPTPVLWEMIFKESLLPPSSKGSLRLLFLEASDMPHLAFSHFMLLLYVWGHIVLQVHLLLPCPTVPQRLIWTWIAHPPLVNTDSHLCSLLWFMTLASPRTWQFLPFFIFPWLCSFSLWVMIVISLCDLALHSSFTRHIFLIL